MDNEPRTIPCPIASNPDAWERYMDELRGGLRASRVPDPNAYEITDARSRAAGDDWDTRETVRP